MHQCLKTLEVLMLSVRLPALLLPASLLTGGGVSTFLMDAWPATVPEPVNRATTGKDCRSVVGNHCRLPSRFEFLNRPLAGFRRLSHGALEAWATFRLDRRLFRQCRLSVKPSFRDPILKNLYLSVLHRFFSCAAAASSASRNALVPDTAVWLACGNSES